MASTGLISNARQTGTLGHVFIDGQKVFRADLPSTSPFAAAPRAATTNLRAADHRDRAAIDARILASVRQAPRQIFNAQSLRTVNWERDTMMTTIDLRDDKDRSFDGDAVLTGVIFEEREARHNARQISLVIWVEIPGNVQRVFEYLKAVVCRCPQLQRLNIDIATESNLALSREIMHTVCIEQEHWRAGRSKFRATIKATVVDSDK